MFLRIALLCIACGALALSRVLVVQNEYPIPRFASLAWFGASDSSAVSSQSGYGKALTASGGASSHIKIKSRSPGSKNLGPLSRLSTMRHRLATQLLGSYTEGVGEMKKKIGARIPRAWLQRRRQQKDGGRWKGESLAPRQTAHESPVGTTIRLPVMSMQCHVALNHGVYMLSDACLIFVMFVTGLDFAQQLAKRLSLGKGVVAANKGQQGMDDKVRETLRRLEEEGLEALSEESWRYAV